MSWKWLWNLNSDTEFRSESCVGFEQPSRTLSHLGLNVKTQRFSIGVDRARESGQQPMCAMMGCGLAACIN
jgi:hypothetical protein